jgi:hypothetical protein
MNTIHVGLRSSTLYSPELLTPLNKPETSKDFHDWAMSGS